MKIFIATDVNIVRDGDRVLTNPKVSTILKRYAAAFGPMVLCARQARLDPTVRTYEDMTDLVSEMIPIASLTDLLLRRNLGSMEKAIASCDLVIGRCPSLCAFRAGDLARKLGKPFLAESMGDPWDAYWNHGLLGKLIAPYMFFKMKSVVKRADYAVYVTTEYLQRRYPCDRESIAASNVKVGAPDPAVLARRREKLEAFDPKQITLMTTAAIDIWYKGHQYVIRAIPKLNALGVRVRYLIVGEGSRDRLAALAAREGVADQVEFTGRLPLSEVFERLDEADLYVQPSLQEGLPRSVIEAMSRGCACIGARTAGIPELLPPDMVVRRKSPDDIVEKIRAWIALDPAEKARLAERNWNEAGKYTADVLDARRNEYFARIMRETGEEAASGARPSGKTGA